MKITTSILCFGLCFFTLVLLSCRTGSKHSLPASPTLIAPGKKIPASNTNTALNTDAIKEIAKDSLLQDIVHLENLVQANPSNKKYIRQLTQFAYDVDRGEIYCVGKGIINTKMPQASYEIGRRKAARYTGLRWALYINSWYNKEKISFGNKISGSIGASTLLLEKTIDDTLYHLYSVATKDISN